MDLRNQCILWATETTELNTIFSVRINSVTVCNLTEEHKYIWKCTLTASKDIAGIKLGSDIKNGQSPSHLLAPCTEKDHDTILRMEKNMHSV